MGNKKKLFKTVFAGGKTYKVNKVGTQIQIPTLVDGKLIGKIIVK